MSDLRIWGVTDPGRCRQRNEDAVAWDPVGRWAMVADGMGGHHAGDVASALVVDTVEAVLRGAGGDARQLLRRAVTAANRRVYEESQGNPKYRGMGATVVVVKFTPRRLVVAHVGDSRLYRLRDNRLEQLTGDHSLVRELVDSGMLSAEQARHSPHRNVITRAIGTASQVDVEVASFATRHGDRLLLCSDGLSDLVDDLGIADLLRTAEGPEAAGRALVDLANASGGTDNIAVVVADIQGA